MKKLLFFATMMVLFLGVASLTTKDVSTSQTIKTECAADILTVDEQAIAAIDNINLPVYVSNGVGNFVLAPIKSNTEIKFMDKTVIFCTCYACSVTWDFSKEGTTCPQCHVSVPYHSNCFKI